MQNQGNLPGVGKEATLTSVGTSGLGSAETHAKGFMIRHQKALGLSAEDIRCLQMLKEKGL